MSESSSKGYALLYAPAGEEPRYYDPVKARFSLTTPRADHLFESRDKALDELARIAVRRVEDPETVLRDYEIVEITIEMAPVSMSSDELLKAMALSRLSPAELEALKRAGMA